MCCIFTVSRRDQLNVVKQYCVMKCVYYGYKLILYLIILLLLDISQHKYNAAATKKY